MRRSTLSLRLGLENLEQRLCLSSITFLEKPPLNPVEHEVGLAGSVVLADLDGDGDLDLIGYGGDLETPRIEWLENTDGLGTYASPQTIWTAEAGAVLARDTSRSLHVADADGDGDADILFAYDPYGFSSREQEIAWLINEDGLGQFGEAQLVAEVLDGGITSFLAYDIDHDGDIDIFYSSGRGDSELGLLRKQEDGYAKREFLGSFDDGSPAIFAEDMDGDGDEDLIVASAERGLLAIIENLDGGFTFERRPQYVVITDEDLRFFVADMDNDGDADIVETSESTALVWHENDGQGTFISENLISERDPELFEIIVIDIDQDGDLDVVTATTGEDGIRRGLVLHVSDDGEFDDSESVVISTNFVRHIDIGDMDGDGDLDIIAKDGARITWFENVDGQRNFVEQAAITSILRDASATTMADLNGDGLQDLIVATDGAIQWREAIAPGQFTTERTLMGDIRRTVKMVPMDVDGDGDIDIVSMENVGRTIAWYENINSATSFSRHVISQIDADYPWLTADFRLADVDADGDSDLMVAWQTGSDAEVGWIENVGGSQGFASGRNTIDNLGKGTMNIATGDFDGDGDIDLATTFVDGSQAAQTVIYDNSDGVGTFVLQTVLTTVAGGYASLDAGDVDGDGDTDLLAGSAVAGGLFWYQSLDGQGTFADPQQIAEHPDAQGVVVETSDLDGDGDDDVIATATSTGTALWFENLGGGAVGPGQFMGDPLPGEVDFILADVDSDGDDDLLSISARKDLPVTGGPQVSVISWQENRLLGDVNNDGRFDTDDLLLLLAAGEFNDGIDGNSTFEEGDFNGDGDFDVDDLLVLLQSGNWQG